jgi:hypothetical protein
MFGKSSASIYRANVRGGEAHDKALMSHLRTLRLLTKDELGFLIKESFKDTNA